MADKTEGTVTQDGKVIARTIPLTGIRKLIAQNMEESLKRSPQASAFVQADMTELIKLKEKSDEKGYKITYSEFLVKLVSFAIEENPIINSARIENRIEVYKSINIGLAASMPNDMLVVPVIQEVQGKDIFQISNESKELVRKVREGTLLPEDMSGGTFTLSSLGMFNVDGITPILNVPQAAILAVGTTRKTPVVDENDNIVIKPMAHFSTTVDHAVINGVPNCRFIQSILKFVEHAGEYIAI